MEKPRLAIDIDETLVWLLPDFLEFYNERHVTSYSIEDFKSYRWWETLEITKEEAYKEASEFIKGEAEHYATNPDSIRYLKLIPCAEQAIELLYHFYELYCITNRDPLLDPYNHAISTALYADEDYAYFPALKFDDNLDGLLIPIDRFYSAVEQGKAKSALCEELGIGAIIDDDADVAIDCAEHGIRAIVLARPWNINLPEHELIYRVNNWQEACSKLVAPSIATRINVYEVY